MLIVALAVPGAFGDDAVLFGRVPPRQAPSSRSLGHRQSRRSDRRDALLGSRRPPSSARRCWWWPASSRGSAHRRVGCRAGDRLPRPNCDRRGPRLESRARALRRAARADHPDRARRVDHRHRRRGRLRAGYGSNRGGDPRDRRRLRALVALLRRGCDRRAETAHGGDRPGAAPARAARLQLPPSADGRRRGALRPRSQDHARRRRHVPRHGARDRALRRRRPATCSGTSPTSSARRTISSGGGRSRRSSCLPSPPLPSRSRPLRRSRS